MKFCFATHGSILGFLRRAGIFQPATLSFFTAWFFASLHYTSKQRLQNAKVVSSCFAKAKHFGAQNATWQQFRT